MAHPVTPGSMVVDVEMPLNPKRSMICRRLFCSSSRSAIRGLANKVLDVAFTVNA